MLGDVLGPGLSLVICGTAAGTRSAHCGQYYAGRGNKLWKTLFEVGLTPRELRPEEYALLPVHGVGLTDLVKGQAGMDDRIVFADVGRERVWRLMLCHEPRVLCLNGKRAAREFLGRKAVEFGLQPERVGDTMVFVAPSTSGAASRYWSIELWRNLAELIKQG